MLSADRLRDFSGSVVTISFSPDLAKYRCILVVTMDGSGWQKTSAHAGKEASAR
jgi:hypothetical protein